VRFAGGAAWDVLGAGADDGVDGFDGRADDAAVTGGADEDGEDGGDDAGLPVLLVHAVAARASSAIARRPFTNRTLLVV
jgi:hypothetical protein